MTPSEENNSMARRSEKPIPLLRVADLFPLLVIHAELLGYRLQSGVELNEGMLDGRMRFMAGPTAVSLGHGFRALAIWVKAEVSPLFREATGILHFDCEAHQVRLEMSSLIDRAFALGVPFVDDEHGLLRPF